MGIAGVETVGYRLQRGDPPMTNSGWLGHVEEGMSRPSLSTRAKVEKGIGIQFQGEQIWPCGGNPKNGQALGIA